MEEILLTDFAPGKIIKRYIYIPGNFIVFSRYHTPTENDINRLKRFNLEGFFYGKDEIQFLETSPDIPDILIDKPDSSAMEPKSIISQPDTEKIFEVQKQEDTIQHDVIQSEKKEDEASQEVQLIHGEITIYGSTVALLHREFSLISKGNKIDVSRIFKITSIILNYVSKTKEEALLQVSRGRSKYRLEIHSVNTGILAALISYHLQVKGKDLINVVSGALMHDVGILLLPNSSNIDAAKKHTLYGFQFLKSIKNIDPVLVMPSIQHHEKAHGNGYPNSITLENIEFSSRITSICDSFDNQISFIKFGNDISIHSTNDELLGWKKEDFDQKIFIASVNVINSIFKNNSIVILNSGELAVIKKVGIRFPLNPVVLIIADKNGNKVREQKIIDLIRAKNIWISRFVKRNVS